jgi:hypothetical protein
VGASGVVGLGKKGIWLIEMKYEQVNILPEKLYFGCLLLDGRRVSDKGLVLENGCYFGEVWKPLPFDNETLEEGFIQPSEINWETVR